ncbi:MAG TPA: UbiA family prenyltransferase, partial [Mycobacteriales bacterium]|nr:UbiA family prenyltransferase [Mycobacteriales bacterium]
MGTVRGLVRACHPEPTAAVTAVAAALAASAGRGVGGTVAVAAAVLAGQLSVGWMNDYLDRERDVRVRRADKPVVAGALAPGPLRTAMLVAAVAVVPLSLLSGWFAGTVHLLAVASAWAYNLRLKSSAL